MRMIAAWIGMCCFTIGGLSLIFGSDLPEETKLPFLASVVLLVVGLALMVYGKHYLGMWFGQLFSGNDDD